MGKGSAGTVLRGLLLLLGVAAAGCEGCLQTDTSCSSDLECKESQQCKDSQCVDRQVAQCLEDVDCGANKTCVGGVCQTRVARPDAGPGTDGGSGSSSSGASGNGILHLDPSNQLEFGDPVLNMDITRSAIVRNDGSGPLTIASIARGATTSAEFTVAPSVALPTTLAVGAEMRVSVTFRLAGAVITPGYIIIVSDAGSCSFNCADPHNVRLALFSEFKGDKQLGLTPTTHDFGFVEVGVQSAVFNLTASNDGSRSRVLTVSAINLTGGGAAHFGLDTAAITLPALLSPGQTLQIPVFYKPLTMATHQATIEVSADSDNPALQHLTATLNGRSVPTVDLSADPINFGSLQLNQVATRTTTIHNNSNVSVQVISGTFANGAGAQGFYLVNSSVFPVVIAAGSTADVEVKFQPTGTAGPRSDALNFTHNLNATPVTAALSGIAEPLPPPPGGPQLELVSTFGRQDYISGCLGPYHNYQNMDLILEGGGGTCEKPLSIGGSCPTDALCTCSFGGMGGGTWRASGGTAPEPYSTESITHNQQGGDGTFTVKNRYWEDCAAQQESAGAAFMQAACSVQPCECWPPALYPILWTPNCNPAGTCAGGSCIHETLCLNYALTFGNSCLAHVASTAKTTVTIRAQNGTVVSAKAFCRVFQTANPSAKSDVVSIIREQGFFRFGTTAAGVTELANVGAACP
jgi:hypothetical protein